MSTLHICDRCTKVIEPYQSRSRVYIPDGTEMDLCTDCRQSLKCTVIDWKGVQK